MDSLDKFAQTRSTKSTHNKTKVIHPKGFEPSIYYSEKTKSGEIVSKPQPSNNVDWQEQLESYFGVDAGNYRVVENTAEIRFWDVNAGMGQIERLYYFKAKIVSDEVYMPDEDFKKLLQLASKKKPLPKQKVTKNTKTFTIALGRFSDW